MPLSKELSKAIGLKCTNFQTTLVGYMIGVEWLSTKAIQGIRIHQVPGRLVLKGCLVLKGRLVSKSRADKRHKLFYIPAIWEQSMRTLILRLRQERTTTHEFGSAIGATDYTILNANVRVP